MKNFFTLSTFTFLLILTLPTPVLAHGGMVGFFEGLLTLFFLGIAFIFSMLILITSSHTARGVIALLNLILLFLSIGLSVHCLVANFDSALLLLAVVWLLINTIVGFALAEQSLPKTTDKVSQKDISNDETGINAKDDYGETLLIKAVNNNEIEKVKTLLNSGANINSKDFYYETPLIKAVKNNNIQIVKMLLDAKADINIKSKYGKTALDYAEDENYAEIITLLKRTSIKG